MVALMNDSPLDPVAQFRKDLHAALSDFEEDQRRRLIPWDDLEALRVSVFDPLRDRAKALGIDYGSECAEFKRNRTPKEGLLS